MSEPKRVIEELIRRKEQKAKFSFEELLFGKQREFVESPAKRKVAVCSRRAGKTHAIVVLCIITALKHDDCHIPYITRTRAQAKRNVWGVFKALDKKYNLKLKFNNNELTVYFPNGSMVFLTGADDEAAIETMRGDKYPLAVIDEAQSFKPYIKTLIEDILEPALMDYDGVLVLTGTPNASCMGYFYNADHQKVMEYEDGEQEDYSEWESFHWTVLDNPFIPEKRKLTFLERKKRSIPASTYAREYEGRWVRDESGLVFRLNPHINIISGWTPIAGDEWEYTLGMDFGYNDSTAFTVFAYNEKKGQTVLVESFKKRELIPSACAVIVQALAQKYDFTRMVGDTGGLGKGYVEEMRQTYGLPIDVAAKADKRGNIELINGAFRSGTLLIDRARNRELLNEIALLQWDDERLMPDPRYEDHLCDAMLYGWRACRRNYEDFDLDAPKPGTTEWYKAIEAAIEDEQDRLFREQQEMSWWEKLA